MPKATPIGESAIAVIRVSGPLSKDLLNKTCKYSNPIPRSSKLCTYHDLNDKLVDEVLVTYFEKGKSYTNNDSFEISCHGNPLISEIICEDLHRRGCRTANPGEFTKLAFLNGKIDLSQAESVAQIILATNKKSLAAAQRNLKGQLSNVLLNIQDQILNLQALLEAYIDFPEDDLNQEDQRKQIKLCETISSDLQNLLEHASKSDCFNKSIKVVLVGLPNAGKSSLFNEIIKKARAIVHSEKGTTRDYLEFNIKIGDHKVTLIDTAGINDSEHDIESIGVELSYQQINEADIVLWVVDGSIPYPTELPTKFFELLNEKTVILVKNKADLGLISWSKEINYRQVEISCKEKKGIGSLEKYISEVINTLDDFDYDELLLINQRHKQLIDKCFQEIECFETKLKKGIGYEMISTHLVLSRKYIDQIIGIKTNEDMLDKLFGEFCIGK